MGALALVAGLALWRLLILGEAPVDPRFQGQFRPYRAVGAAQAALHPDLLALAPDPARDPLDRYRVYWGSLLHDDALLSVWPEHVVTREQIRRGQLPLWNPDVLAGTPLFAAGMSSPASPLSWPGYLLPAVWGRGVVLWLHLLLAGGCFYAFLVQRRQGAPAALVGGLTYMLNPLFVHWLYYGSAVPVMGLAPLGLMAVDALASRLRARRVQAEKDGGGGASVRAGGLPWRAGAALGAVVALEVLSGNAQFALYAVVLQGLYAVARAIRGSGDGPNAAAGPDPAPGAHPSAKVGRASGAGLELVVWAGAFSLLGVLAAALFLLPFLELVAQAGRSAAKYRETNFLDPRLLLAWLFPGLYGHPGQGNYVGGFLFFRPYSTVFGPTIGVLALGLAVLGAIRDRQRAWPAIAAVVVPLAGLVALSHPGLRAAAHGHLPGLASLDVVRALVFVYLALAWLAALGAQQLLGPPAAVREPAPAGPPASPRASPRLASPLVRTALLLPAAMLAITLALEIFTRLGSASDRLVLHLRHLQQPTLLLSPRLLLPLGLALGLAALSQLVRRRPLWAPPVAGALAGALALELLLLARPGLPSTPAAELLPSRPVIDNLRAAERGDPVAGAGAGRGRMVGLTERDSFPAYTGDNLPPNTAAAYGIADLRGYVPLPAAPVLELLAASAGHSFPAAVTFTAASVDRPLLDLFDVRHVLGAGPLPGPRFSPAGPGLWRNTGARGRAFFTRCSEVIEDPAARLARLTRPSGVPPAAVALLEEPVPGAPVCPADPAPLALAVRDPHPARVEIEVDAPAAGVVVLADAWFPGWEVTVDGLAQPLLRVDHALRGVLVDPGPHRVRFQYRPGSLRDGAWLSLLAGLVLLACAWGRRPRLTDDALLALVAALALFAFADRPALPNDNDALYAGVMRTLREGVGLIHLSLGAHPFLDKPPLFFWIGAALTALLGESELVLRLPALLAGVLGVVLVARTTRRFTGSRAAAALAGLALLAAPSYYEYARRVYMEVPVAVLGFWAFDLALRERWRRAGLAGGAAFLLKTVVGVLGLAALAAAHLLRRRLPRGLIEAAAVALAVVFPWHLAAYLHAPEVFLDFTTRLHLRDQIASAQPWSTGGPFYYLGVLATQDVVIGLLLLAGVVIGLRDWRRSRDFALGALLLAVALQLALYSASATKKSFYLLTLYPFAAVLGGRALAPWLDHPTRQRLLRPLAAVALIVLFAAGSGPLVRPALEEQESTYLAPLARRMAELAGPGDRLYALDTYLAAPQFYSGREATYAIRSAALKQVLDRIPYLRHGQKVVVWSDDLLRGGHFVLTPAPVAADLVRRNPDLRVAARNAGYWLLQGPR